MKRNVYRGLYIVLCLCLWVAAVQGQVRSTRVMAANITSGNYQRYEGPGIRIFQAFKPDICCIQEFNYDGAISDLINQAFGPDYRYYREHYTGSGDIPNGIVYHKDFVMLDSGSWDDSQIPNRGYAYVRLDVPGEHNPHLFVISVHLSTKSSKRSVEARELLQYLLNYFHVQSHAQISDYVILAGDFNAGSRSAQVLYILQQESQGFFVDQPIPVDQQGISATNSSRSKEHDFILVNPLLNQYYTVLTIGSHEFLNGLVFDSRVYTPLSEVAPVQQGDCGATNMQHMAVIKQFLLPTD